MPSSDEIVVVHTWHSLLLLSLPSARAVLAEQLQHMPGHSLRVRNANWLADSLRSHPDALRRLRHMIDRAHLAGATVSLTDAALIALVVRQIEQGGLLAFRLPSTRTDVLIAPAGAATPPAPSSESGAPKPVTAPRPPDSANARPVTDWSPAEKLEAVLQRTVPLLPDDLGQALRALLSPVSIAITVATFVAFAASQAFGVGEFADGVLAVVAYSVAGFSGLLALYDLIRASISATQAHTSADLDHCAQRFARDLITLGMAFLTVFLVRTARANETIKSGGAAADTGDAAASAGTRGSTAADTRSSAPPPDEAPGPFLPKKYGETEPGAVEMTPELQAEMDAAHARGGMSADGYPDLPPDVAKTFGETPRPWNGDDAAGPIYRVVDADSNPSGSYWSPNAPTTEAQWRGGSAVQNDWNGDGGQVQANPGGLRGWIGKAAPQPSSDGVSALPGGAEQIWIPSNSAQPSAATPTPWNGGSAP